MADRAPSAEERLARALYHPKMAVGALVSVALKDAGLALYDPAEANAMAAQLCRVQAGSSRINKLDRAIITEAIAFLRGGSDA